MCIMNSSVSVSISICSLAGRALIDGIAQVLEVPLLGKVLSNQGLGFLPQESSFPHDSLSTSQYGLNGKANTWSRKTKMPEMELLLLVPERRALAKVFSLFFQSPEHSSNVATTHEDLGELFRDVVLSIPH